MTEKKEYDNSKILSEYSLSEKIVPGDHPQVVKAMSKNTGQFVAIKFFPQNIIPDIHSRECAKMINYLSSINHNHIVKILEVQMLNSETLMDGGKVMGGIFIVMDWCDGTSIKNTLDRFKVLPEKLIGRYTGEILQGLQYLHQQGESHKNLKASNLLLAGGVLKLSDFGLSALVSNRNISQHPYYSAPEVLENGTYSEASDVWALGAVIVELLTGKPPYADLSPEDARMKILSDEPMPIPFAASAHLGDFLRGCFEKHPSNRLTINECFKKFFVMNNAQEMPKEFSAPSIQIHLPSAQKPNQNLDFSFLEEPPKDQSEKPPDEPEQKLSIKPERKTVSFQGITPAEKVTGEKKQSTIQRLSATMVSGQSDQMPMSEELEKFKDNEDYNFDNDEVTPLKIKAPTPKRVDFTKLDDDDNDEILFAHRNAIEQKKEQLMAELKRISRQTDNKELTNRFTKIYNVISEEPCVRSCIIEQQGLMPIIEIVERGASLTNELALIVLKVIYAILEDQLQIKESYCLLGGIPPVLKFLEANSHPKDIRAMAMKITNEICKTGKNQPSDNIQMFISCDGINSLVQTLKYDILEESDLVVISIHDIHFIINSRCGIQSADLCRLFMSAGLIPLLSDALLKFVDTPSIRSKEAIHDICEILEKFGQGDSKVRVELAQEEVMSKIVQSMFDIETNTPKYILSIDDILCLSRAIKYVASDSDSRDSLQKAHVIEMGCALVKVDYGNQNTKIHAPLIEMLSNMCKLSKERQAIVAKSRLIKFLRPYLEENQSEMKSLVLLMLNEFPSISNKIPEAMIQMIEDGLVEIYLSALKQSYWGTRSMYSLSKLSPYKQFHIFSILMVEENLYKIKEALKNVNNDNEPTMLHSLAAICKESREFTTHLSKIIVQLISEKLSNSLKGKADSQIPLAVLELILALLDNNDDPAPLLTNEIKQNVETFLSKGNVKQKSVAQSILKFFPEPEKSEDA